MIKRIRTLVFPGGTEVGLEIFHALRHSVHVELYGAASRNDHSQQVFARHALLPNIVDGDFDIRFAELLARWRIELVFASHDSVLEYLAPRVAGWGVHLVNSSLEATRVARSKLATYSCFANEPWIPRYYDSLDQISEWPILIKPDDGQGGQGVVRATNRLQAQVALMEMKSSVICEYLPGEELTVDCFTDFRRRLLFIGPRNRERVSGGIAMRSQRLSLVAEIEYIAQCINRNLTLRGPWFFQIKQDAAGKWKLLELSCRLASSSTVQRAAGVNLPLMAVQDYLQRDQQVLEEARITLLERRLSGTAVLDYAFDTAYLDLDDTLLDGIQANPQAMCFVYRLVQMGKRRVLVTRHEGDVQDALAAAHISPSLFDEIVQLQGGELKSSVITGRAIFVDNHFPERLEVSQCHGIPVFDVDALELLFS